MTALIDRPLTHDAPLDPIDPAGMDLDAFAAELGERYVPMLADFIAVLNGLEPSHPPAVAGLDAPAALNGSAVEMFG